jgi:hypothetical protein
MQRCERRASLGGMSQRRRVGTAGISRRPDRSNERKPEGGVALRVLGGLSSELDKEQLRTRLLSRRPLNWNPRKWGRARRAFSQHNERLAITWLCQVWRDLCIERGKSLRRSGDLDYAVELFVEAWYGVAPSAPFHTRHIVLQHCVNREALSTIVHAFDERYTLADEQNLVRRVFTFLMQEDVRIGPPEQDEL